MKYSVILIMMMMLWTSCSRENQAEEKGLYFDLIQFLEQAVQTKNSVTKIVLLDGQADTLQIADYRWEAEQALLQQWDINRPAWQGRYDSISETLTDGRRHIRYTTEDKELPVRNFDVYQRQDATVDSIRIVHAVDNWLYRSSTEVHYAPGRLFIMEQTNQRWMGKDTELRITVLVD